MAWSVAGTSWRSRSRRCSSLCRQAAGLVGITGYSLDGPALRR